MNTHDARVALALTQKFSLPPIMGDIMAMRGIDMTDAEGFLFPCVRDTLPDPSCFCQMDLAVERIADAIEQGEVIGVFGDYDVDGASASALLKRHCDALGVSCLIHIPDRLKEGYGPNAPALLDLHRLGARLVITVDCGTASFEAFEAARAVGLDIIVLDHHETLATLPPALAIVNPKRPDDDSAHAHLCAAGLVFLCLVGVNRTLRARGFFHGTRCEPDLLAMLDLVALATVCDVVPLHGVNRAFVAQGLKVMARRQNLGLSTLCDVAGLNATPEAYHAGFVLGPRLNAGGRVGQAQTGATLLATQDSTEAKHLACLLDTWNDERRTIEKDVLEQALLHTEATDGSSAPIVAPAAEGWHPGVIGIVASRLVERYGRPSLVMTIGEDDIVTGSARSVNTIDLGRAVIAAKEEGLLIRGGGHAMAAGFALRRECLDDFRRFMAEAVSRQTDGQDTRPTLNLDGILSPGSITVELLKEMERLGPFGMGNRAPRFMIKNVRLLHANIVAYEHVRCRCSDAGGAVLEAIAFRVMGTALGTFLVQNKDALIHLVGKVQLNTWRDRTRAQMVIEDAAPA